MKIELNPEKTQSVQSTTAVDAATAASAGAEKVAKENTTGGLTRDIWDKRNLWNAIGDLWDSEDTATVSEEARRGMGIVGDPRILEDASAAIKENTAETNENELK